MKMYRKEMTLKEWEEALDKRAEIVCSSKEAAIKDLQDAGILDENGDLAPQYRSGEAPEKLKTLPKFANADEELEYIETHDSTEYIESLPRAPMFQLAPEEKERIASRSRQKKNRV